MVTSIWPSCCSQRNTIEPIPAPIMPPATRTPPIVRSTPPRFQYASAPDTLAPVICVADDATATAGGMP